MRRDKFIIDGGLQSFEDPKTGSILRVYNDRIIKTKTIWRVKTPPNGMIVINEQVKHYNQETSNYDGNDSWDVAWRNDKGDENFLWNMTSEEILGKFDPVFRIL